MRIELNSGGLGSRATISSFQTDFSSLISKSRKMVSSFQAVKNFTYNINGGVGALQSAVDQIESRITIEKTKTAGLEAIEKKANSFLELAQQIDLNVCKLVNQNKHEFYEVNPWSKPPQTEEEKKWYEKAGEWLCQKGEKIKNELENFGNLVVDKASKLWDSAVEFYKSHKETINAILKIAASVVIVVGLIGLTVATWGTAGAVIFGMGAIGAGAGGISGVAKGVHEYNNGGDENGSLLTAISNNMLKGTIEGGASGIADGIGLVVPGGVFTRFIAGEVLQVGAKGFNNQFIDGQSAEEAWGGAIVDGTVSNLVDTAAFGVLSTANRAKNAVSVPTNQILQYASKEVMYKDSYKYWTKEVVNEAIKSEIILSVPKTILSLFTGCDGASDAAGNVYTGHEVY